MISAGTSTERLTGGMPHQPPLHTETTRELERIPNQPRKYFKKGDREIEREKKTKENCGFGGRGQQRPR